jgi:endonuclease-3 related protein
MDAPNLKRILQNTYRLLFTKYGPQHWWPAEEPFEVIVGAILTQSAAWTNVEKAIKNLKQADALKPDALRQLPQDELARLIHACGYYNVKARKLKAFVEWFGENYGDNLKKLFTEDTSELRKQLLDIYGIGEETADSILLYAGNKPIFVIDAYTRRIMGRMGISPHRDSYAAWQGLFMANLPADTTLFNEYHALLVRLAKDVCRTKPLCRQCCLNPTAKNASKGFPCRYLHRKE